MPTRTKTRITLWDVARRADVSVASVSLALRNSPRISEETKQRVTDICNELGYVRDGRLCEPMSHLRSIDRKEGGATLIAVITHPNSGHSDCRELFAALLRTIQSEAERMGYKVDLFDIVKDGIKPSRFFVRNGRLGAE